MTASVRDPARGERPPRLEEQGRAHRLPDVPDDAARQSAAEYAPTPLFGVGTPELAGSELTRVARDTAAPILEPYEDVSKRAADRMQVTVDAR